MSKCPRAATGKCPSAASEIFSRTVGAIYWADRFGRSFRPMLGDYVCYNALNISQFRRYRWRHKIRKFAVEVCQNVEISRRDCAKILRMVTIEIL